MGTTCVPNLPNQNLLAKIPWLKLSWNCPMDMIIPLLTIKILLEYHGACKTVIRLCASL